MGTVVAVEASNQSFLIVTINVTICTQLLSLDNVVAKILVIAIGEKTEYKVSSTFLV